MPIPDLDYSAIIASPWFAVLLMFIVAVVVTFAMWKQVSDDDD